MAKYFVLYNPFSGNCDWENQSKEIEKLVDGEMECCDITKENAEDILNRIPEEDNIVIVGGDGTLNHFVNDIECDSITNAVYYYAAGTGNDFMRDVATPDNNKLVRIDKYLKDLPVVTVEGKQYKFVNGVGYGIDGYCCEVGDQLRASSDKPVNYAGIAIKGLLFFYKPTSAKVTVDGVVHEYKKVWLVPTMYGKYYGGGMIPTSKQQRNNTTHTVSVMLIHDSGKLKTLMAFPSIFQGKIEENTKIVDVFSGHDIKVEFNEPRALQIDGETILGVKEYSVKY